MIGTGYVGLVSGACVADFGNHVTCVDRDTDKIAALIRGEIPIFEPGIEELVISNTLAVRPSFTTNLAESSSEADAVLNAVGTPSRRGNGHAELAYVYTAAREIAATAGKFTVVVTTSTIPVSTGDERAQNHRRYPLAAIAQSGTDHVHGAPHCRDDQIRGLCLPCHSDLSGSFFSKDTHALLKTAQDHDVPLRIVDTVRALNDDRKRPMARKVANAVGGRCAVRALPCWPHVQLRYRRHARSFVDSIDNLATRYGCQGPRIRSRRHEAGALGIAGDRLL